MNASAVAFALRQAAHPLPAALAAGGAAGLQSALLQWSPINERYARFLNRAPSEPVRFLRWVAVSSLYCLFMQLAGALAARTDIRFGMTLLLALRASALGAGQYPWVAAIALRRARAERQRRSCPDRVRLIADVETMLVSAFFVSLSTLGALGHGASRPLLVAAGVLGLLSYAALKTRGLTQAIAAQTSSFSMRVVDP